MKRRAKLAPEWDALGELDRYSKAQVREPVKKRTNLVPKRDAPGALPRVLSILP
jgi:hypothetical protein